MRTFVTLVIAAVLAGCGGGDGAEGGDDDLTVSVRSAQTGSAMCDVSPNTIAAAQELVPVLAVDEGEATVRILDSSGEVIYENPAGTGEPDQGQPIPNEPTVDLEAGEYTVECQAGDRTESTKLTVTGADGDGGGY